jgi:hypothetical protein
MGSVYQTSWDVSFPPSPQEVDIEVIDLVGQAGSACRYSFYASECLLLMHSSVTKGTPSELPSEAAPALVPVEELWLSSPEDAELAELGHLLEISIGDALGLGVNEVQWRWFVSESNAAVAVGSHNVLSYQEWTGQWWGTGGRL